MKLDEYVDRAVQAAKNAGVRLNRKSVLEDLSTSAGVNFQTLAAAERGARMGQYEKALAVSKATGYLVSVVELCDPNPEDTLARIRGGM